MNAMFLFLVGWLTLNLGMAAKQWIKRKAVFGVGSFSPAMLLVVLSQGFYVWDALYQVGHEIRAE
jgi:hypothetical protein